MKLAKNILNQMKHLRKSQIQCMLILFKAALSLTGRIYFLNVSRYRQLNEKTYWRNFRRYFHFVPFNSSLIETVYHPQNEYLLALDASFIPKSGKATYGYRPNRGLEISSLTLVDVTYKTAYTLTAGQVPPVQRSSEENTLDFFLGQLRTLQQEKIPVTLPRTLAVDGFYTKKRFIDGSLDAGYQIVGKLRKDANLKYLCQAPKYHKRKRGRPRLYTARVIINSPEVSKFQYQIEFTYRDAKQYLGLTHSQARCQQGLKFHFNLSLSLLNLVRIEHR